MKKLTKKQLIKRCNSLFESNSKFQQDYAKLLERKVLEADAVLKELDQVPRVIYIG